VITSLTKETELKPLQGLNLPILIAQYWYSQHSNINFPVDLNHYLHEGQVLSTPGVFAMGKLVEIAKEPVFFVRFACGKLEELSDHLPPEIRSIAFCRNNQGNVRKYSVDRLKELSSVPSLTSPIFSMNNILEGGRFRSAA
jgi:hypothetical protein